MIRNPPHGRSGENEDLIGLCGWNSENLPLGNAHKMHGFLLRCGLSFGPSWNARKLVVVWRVFYCVFDYEDGMCFGHNVYLQSEF